MRSSFLCIRFCLSEIKLFRHFYLPRKDLKASMHNWFKDAISHFFQGIQLGTTSYFNNNTKYYISAKFHACLRNRTILPKFCHLPVYEFHPRTPLIFKNYFNSIWKELEGNLSTAFILILLNQLILNYLLTVRGPYWLLARSFGVPPKLVRTVHNNSSIPVDKYSLCPWIRSPIFYFRSQCVSYKRRLENLVSKFLIFRPYCNCPPSRWALFVWNFLQHFHVILMH